MPAARASCRLCLLLLSSLGASGALASSAPPAAPDFQPFGPPPVTSCIGTDACLNTTGPIGDNSCNGNFACKDSTGSIGDNSCVGLGACTGATGTIGDNSCNGQIACGLGSVNTSANIGDNSCNGITTCDGSSGTIGANSCNGTLSCAERTGTAVGDNSCNGDLACYQKATAVGDCASNTPGHLPAACGGPEPDARIRRAGGELWGNNIYRDTGANQYVSMKIYAGDFRRVYISVQNDGTVDDSVSFCQCSYAIRPGASVRYFRGDTDITADVVAGTYSTPTLQPGEKFVIRARVAIDSTAFKHDLSSATVWATSQVNNTITDRVTIWVQRK